MRARTAVLAILSFYSPVSIAQYHQNPIVGGVPVYCNGPAGTVFTSYRQTGDWAKASIDMTPRGALPVILLDPQVFSTLPGPVLQFVYGHECMHHLLGHVYGNMNFGMEVHADCEAAKMLRNQGFLNGSTIRLVASYFQNSPPVPPYYPAGPERAARILACFNSP